MTFQTEYTKLSENYPRETVEWQESLVKQGLTHKKPAEETFKMFNAMSEELNNFKLEIIREIGKIPQQTIEQAREIFAEKYTEKELCEVKTKVEKMSERGEGRVFQVLLVALNIITLLAVAYVGTK